VTFWQYAAETIELKCVCAVAT